MLRDQRRHGFVIRNLLDRETRRKGLAAKVVKEDSMTGLAQSLGCGLCNGVVKTPWTGMGEDDEEVHVGS